MCKFPKVCISLVSFKNHLSTRYNHFVSCLSSLTCLTKYQKYEIHIVDYGTVGLSSTVSKIKSSNNVEIKLIKVDKDHGLAQRRNLALKTGYDCGAKYIVMMDDDVVIIDPEWLNKLVQLMENLPKNVVAAQPILIEETGKSTAGGFLYRNASTYSFSINKNLENKRTWKTFITSGSCFIVRSSYIKEFYMCNIEPYCQLLLMQSEDTDFQLKIYLRKYQAVGTSVTSVLHNRPEQYRFPPWRTFLQFRNRVLLLLLHFSCKHIIKYISFRVIQDAIVSILIDPKKNGAKAIRFLLLIKAYFWVIRNLKIIFQIRLQLQKYWWLTDDKHLEKILLSELLPLKNDHS